MQNHVTTIATSGQALLLRQGVSERLLPVGCKIPRSRIADSSTHRPVSPSKSSNSASYIKIILESEDAPRMSFRASVESETS